MKASIVSKGFDNYSCARSKDEVVLVVLVDRMITVAGIHLLQLYTRNEDVCGNLDVRGLARFQSETRAEGMIRRRHCVWI